MSEERVFANAKAYYRQITSRIPVGTWVVIRNERLIGKFPTHGRARKFLDDYLAAYRRNTKTVVIVLECVGHESRIKS